MQGHIMIWLDQVIIKLKMDKRRNQDVLSGSKTRTRGAVLLILYLLPEIWDQVSIMWKNLKSSQFTNTKKVVFSLPK
jgi:hypothetical protein